MTTLRPWNKPSEPRNAPAAPRPWMNGHTAQGGAAPHVAEPPASLIDHGLIAWHCGVLFEHCRRLGLSEKGILVLCAFDPLDEKAKRHVMHYSPARDAAPADMAEMARIWAERFNVYCALTLMRSSLEPSKRGKKDDIVAVFGAVIDADLDKEGKPFRPPEIAPSFTLTTSRVPHENRQPVYLFDRALSVADAEARALELHAKAGGDSGSKDITHVWRIAGTLNHPNAVKIARGRPKDPQLVSVEVSV